MEAENINSIINNTEQETENKQSTFENKEYIEKTNQNKNSTNEIQKITRENMSETENNSSTSEVPTDVQDKTTITNKEEEREESIEAGSDEWFKADQKKFKSTFPDVNSEELFSDPIFLEFAEKRAGVESMVDIYSTYLSVSRKIEAKIMEKAEKDFKTRLANAKASPGSLTESTKVADRLYSFDELKKMSPDAIERNWDKVQRSMKTFGK